MLSRLNILPVWVTAAFVLAFIGCADIGERDNPTDPIAENYDPTAINSSQAITGTVFQKRASWDYLNPKVFYGYFVDSRDHMMYRTVSIDQKVWFAENLSYTKAGKCFDNDSTLCGKYGRLYTWKEASTACPEGYHLPTKAEWNDLPDVEFLIASKGWLIDDGRSGGSNESGLSILPSGRYAAGKGSDTGFVDLAYSAYMWTSTKVSDDSAYFMLFSSRPERWASKALKKERYSVRCVGDSVTKFVPTILDSIQILDTLAKANLSSFL